MLPFASVGSGVGSCVIFCCQSQPINPQAFAAASSFQGCPVAGSLPTGVNVVPIPVLPDDKVGRGTELLSRLVQPVAALSCSSSEKKDVPPPGATGVTKLTRPDFLS